MFCNLMYTTYIYLLSLRLNVFTHRVCDSWSEGPGFESCAGCCGVDIHSDAELVHVADMSTTLTKDIPIEKLH